jgi:hypothetical protein
MARPAATAQKTPENEVDTGAVGDAHPAAMRRKASPLTDLLARPKLNISTTVLADSPRERHRQIVR